MQREAVRVEFYSEEGAMGRAVQAWRVLTAPFRLVAEIVRIPGQFRRQLFVRGRGSDTGNLSPRGT